MSSDKEHGGGTILAVVVAFQRSVECIEAWQTLRAWLDVDDEQTRARLERILLYDNSPQPQAAPDVERCFYVHDANNGGTGAAYTLAAGVAERIGCDWMLLLDQDTKLPQGYLQAAAVMIAAVEGSSTVALVPRVMARQGHYVSPARLTRFGGFRPLASSELPRAGEVLYALASGCLFKTSAFIDLLPLPPQLWLDYVDHWIFAQLQRRGGKVMMLEQALEHDLSVMDIGALSGARMSSLLQAEAYFQRLLGTQAKFAYPLRLAWRSLRLAFTNPRLALAVIRAMRFGR